MAQKKPKPFFERGLFAECPECHGLVLKQHLTDHVYAHHELEVWLGERFPKQGKKKDQPNPFAALGG